jgi:methylthioribose-1-phosphate isomerase
VDRVARDGSVANKIGSADIARVADLYGTVDFYYATSYSTIDLQTEKGIDIPIEERSPDEVTYLYCLEAEDKRKNKIISERSLKEWPPKNILTNKKIPGKGEIAIYNPSFDVTPPKLIDLIITDIGVFAPHQIKTLTDEKMNQIVNQRLGAQGIKVPEIILV